VSYIFFVWEHPKAIPAPASPEQAWQFVRVASSIPAEMNPRYQAFARALTAHYPDLESMPDTGVDSDTCVWADSPIDGQTELAVYTIGVRNSCMDYDLLWHIVHAACDEGLYVLDRQSATLYRPDRTYIDMEGRTAIANLQRPHRPEPNWEEPAGCVAKSIGGKSIKEAVEQIVEVVARFHAPADFMPFVPEPVQHLARERTKCLPASADDVPILFSGHFDSTGMSTVEIAAQRRRLQRERKEQVFRAMQAVHAYFHA